MNFRIPTPSSTNFSPYLAPSAGNRIVADWRPEAGIYAFRGADIFTYMKARSEVHAHYTLDTNWRSAPGMVNSVNKLFSQTDDAFMFREIPFIPVKSAGKNQALRFVFKGETQPAMKMWLMEGESCGVGDYQSTMAQVCAAQIRDWLQAGQRGERC